MVGCLVLKGISAHRRARIFAATDGGQTARYGAQATVAPHAQKKDPMPRANHTDDRVVTRPRPVRRACPTFLTWNILEGILQGPQLGTLVV